MNQSLDHDVDGLEGCHGAGVPGVISGSGLGAIVAVRPPAWQIFACSLFPKSFQSAQLFS